MDVAFYLELSGYWVKLQFTCEMMRSILPGFVKRKSLSLSEGKDDNGDCDIDDVRKVLIV